VIPAGTAVTARYATRLALTGEPPGECPGLPLARTDAAVAGGGLAMKRATAVLPTVPGLPAAAVKAAAKASTPVRGVKRHSSSCACDLRARSACRRSSRALAHSSCRCHMSRPSATVTCRLGGGRAGAVTESEAVGMSRPAAADTGAPPLPLTPRAAPTLALRPPPPLPPPAALAGSRPRGPGSADAARGPAPATAVAKARPRDGDAASVAAMLARRCAATAAGAATPVAGVKVHCAISDSATAAARS